MNLETSKYYSHGKLLITGEYTVLYGAAALALPAKFGQVMTCNCLIRRKTRKPAGCRKFCMQLGKYALSLRQKAATTSIRNLNFL